MDGLKVKTGHETLVGLHETHLKQYAYALLIGDF